MISICKVNNFFADKSQSDEDFVVSLQTINGVRNGLNRE